MSPRSRLGACNFLHGVAENQAHFLKECLKIIHRTRFKWSDFRHSKARLRKRGRESGTEMKNVVENRPPARETRERLPLDSCRMVVSVTLSGALPKHVPNTFHEAGHSAGSTPAWLSLSSLEAEHFAEPLRRVALSQTRHRVTISHFERRHEAFLEWVKDEVRLAGR